MTARQRAALYLPALFGAAFVVCGIGAGHTAVRLSMSMPLHELGHAVTSWFTGFAAIPTLWKTLIPETRSLWVPVLLAGGLAAAGMLGWRTERLWIAIVAAALGALLFLGDTCDADFAHALITFGGDAGGLVLGATLVLPWLLAPATSRIHRGQLSLGLAGIGAFAWVDIASLWWRARGDATVIPYGEIEGVGLSDPSKLLEVHLWAEPTIVHRYSLVIGVTAVAMLAAGGYAVWAATGSRVRQPQD